ncbi:hypothetical protein ACIPJ1_13735 [Microbacterium maritypicum]|uniref:hypothetical protein n=1 Tax=Microbacterium maritypicum TaxID=33918 RepID=UPI00381A9C93
MSRGEKSCLHSAGDVVELGDSVEDGWALQDPEACDAPTPGAELGVDGDGVGRSEGLRDALKEWHLLSMRGASRRDDHTVRRVLQAHTANCAARTRERPTTTEWLAVCPRPVPRRWDALKSRRWSAAVADARDGLLGVGFAGRTFRRRMQKGDPGK